MASCLIPSDFHSGQGRDDFVSIQWECTLLHYGGASSVTKIQFDSQVGVDAGVGENDAEVALFAEQSVEKWVFILAKLHQSTLCGSGGASRLPSYPSYPSYPSCYCSRRL
jgi:hypothetical protein